MTLLLFVMASFAFAQEQKAVPAPVASQIPAPTVTPSKGKNAREKETEGTQALNRFEADTILKSRYQLDGQPLEVDPD